MIKKTITYVDYNGEERKEDYFFNLTKAEVMEMQLSKAESFSEYLRNIVDSKDVPAIAETFKKIILKSYGERSIDGRMFRKIAVDGHKLADDFAQTEAFSELYTELATDEVKAEEFIRGVLPKDINGSSKTDFAKNVVAKS